MRINVHIDNAIADFTRAIRLDPTLAKAYAARADVLHRKVNSSAPSSTMTRQSG
jgi:hypothetical protein